MTERIALASSPGFGGQKAQNKRNRRTKRINRRNGIGMVTSFPSLQGSFWGYVIARHEAISSVNQIASPTEKEASNV